MIAKFAEDYGARMIHGVGACVCIGAIVSSCAVVFAVNRQRTQATDARILAVQQAQEEAESLAERVRDFDARRIALESELALIVSPEPASRPTEALADLVLVAEQVGLQVIDTSVESAAAEGVHWRAPVGLTVSGGFGQVTEFLDRIWTEHPGVTTSGVRIAQQGQNGRLTCRIDCAVLVDPADKG